MGSPRFGTGPIIAKLWDKVFNCTEEKEVNGNRSIVRSTTMYPTYSAQIDLACQYFSAEA